VRFIDKHVAADDVIPIIHTLILV